MNNAMLKWIDYIWFVGESFHVWEKSPGDGEALLMGCWYLDAALPLLTFLHRVAGGWWFYLAAVPVVLLVPFVFCRFRYTAKRRDEIFARFSHKHTGRRLLAIGAVIAGICCLEAFLMLHFGFWKLGSRF